MFFSTKDRWASRKPRGEEIDGRETSLFIPQSTLHDRGAPRLVGEWVDKARLLEMKPKDGRCYNVVGNLLNPRKGKTMTPRREMVFGAADKEVPGPGRYAPPAPPLLKPTFNRGNFAPVLPDSPTSPSRRRSPRVKGAYLRLSPDRQDEADGGGGVRDNKILHRKGNGHRHGHGPAQGHRSSYDSPDSDWALLDALARPNSPPQIEDENFKPLQAQAQVQSPAPALRSLVAEESSLPDALLHHVSIPGKPLNKMRDIKFQLSKLREILKKQPAETGTTRLTKTGTTARPTSTSTLDFHS